MIVEASAPTRIDLSGGTLDLYPLYLFLEGGVTNNAAIDVRCTVRIETRDDSEIHLKSLDLGAELAAPSLDALPTEDDLGLVARVVRFYAPRTGVDVVTTGGRSVVSGRVHAISRPAASTLMPGPGTARWVAGSSSTPTRTRARPAKEVTTAIGAER